MMRRTSQGQDLAGRSNGTQMDQVFVIALLALELLSTPAWAQQRPYRVEFIISRTRSDIFFKPATGFLEAAGLSLGMQVDVLETNDNHLIAGDLVKQALATTPKPDGVIGISNKESGIEMLRACEEANVPFMTEVATILTEGFGGPRKKHPLFIGEVLPNDEKAGYDLAIYLIGRGVVAADGKVHVVAISGPLGNSSSVERERGLARAMKDSPRAVLDQVVHARWERATAAEMFTGLKNRYPRVSVAWSASDGMALGIADAAEALKLRLGRDIVIGGVDGTPEGIDAILKNRIQASAGGLFTEEAWALVVMYDYLNGVDFAPHDGVHILTAMQLVTEKNAKQYSVLLNSENWKKVDFRSFSRKDNPTLTHYDFSLARVLRQISADSRVH
jgi:ABC-type sugar transport system substrate-binding protein